MTGARTGRDDARSHERVIHAYGQTVDVEDARVVEDAPPARALDTANAVWPARRALADAQPGEPKWRT